MRPSSKTAIGLGLIAVACTAKVETPTPGTAQSALSAAQLDTVKAVDAAFAAAMNAKDSAAVMANYADDAQFLPPDSPILDKAATATAIAGFFAGGAGDFALTPVAAYGTGDLAYIVGTVSYKVKGVAQTDKYAEVLRRGADGRWRYVVDMFNSVAPPATQPTTK